MAKERAILAGALFGGFAGLFTVNMADPLLGIAAHLIGSAIGGVVIAWGAQKMMSRS